MREEGINLGLADEGSLAKSAELEVQRLLPEAAIVPWPFARNTQFSAPYPNSYIWKIC
jgi:hypothetical protein